jgi:pimeloyl-ACP methyl ester carboxylesterase
MNVSPAINPPIENCLDVPPAPRFIAPQRFVDQPNEFRLIPMLREAAQRKDPYEILARAAAVFYRAQHPQSGSIPANDVALGKALADLAVTGRVAYTRFQKTPTWLIGAVNGGLIASLVHADRLSVDTLALLTSLSQATPTDFANAVNPALDRAFDVAWALRGPVAPQPAQRTPSAWFAARSASLGWIAVSGEDDTPHRPVNIAPPEFEQFEISVTVPGRARLPTVTVLTRFFIASAVEDTPAARILPSNRTTPPDPVPHVPDDHWVILFLHGHSSSAEEAGPIIPHIHMAGLDRSTKYSIISLDLPNSGYSQMFDHIRVAPSSATSWPGAPTDHGPILTPILDFMEDFVVAFVDALDQKTPIKNRFAGVIGGSLGGNLGFRLGRRPLAANPWLNAAIVAWSPASVWLPKVQDLAQGVAPKHCRGLWDLPEELDSRRLYFREAYDTKLPFVNRKPPELWYWDDWPCKTSHIQESRIARQEIYNARFRQWHWRLAGEQMIYSHDDHVIHDDKASQLRFEQNTVRMLLVAGDKDDFLYAKIYSCTQGLAERMGNTPGLSLFLNNTGHSLHIERPRFFAGEIVNFFGLPALTRPIISFLVPLLLSDPMPSEIKRTDISFLVPLLLSEPAPSEIKRTDISFIPPLLL